MFTTAFTATTITTTPAPVTESGTAIVVVPPAPPAAEMSGRWGYRRGYWVRH